MTSLHRQQVQFEATDHLVIAVLSYTAAAVVWVVMVAVDPTASALAMMLLIVTLYLSLCSGEQNWRLYRADRDRLRD